MLKSSLVMTRTWTFFLSLVLGISLTEKKAFQTKIICLINLDKFDEALSSIERFNFADGDDLCFERAYCQYRLHQLNEAYQTLAGCQNPGMKEKELLAQIVSSFQEEFVGFVNVESNVWNSLIGWSDIRRLMTLIGISLRTLMLT